MIVNTQGLKREDVLFILCKTAIKKLCSKFASENGFTDSNYQTCKNLYNSDDNINTAINKALKAKDKNYYFENIVIGGYELPIKVSLINKNEFESTEFDLMYGVDPETLAIKPIAEEVIKKSRPIDYDSMSVERKTSGTLFRRLSSLSLMSGSETPPSSQSTSAATSTSASPSVSRGTSPSFAMFTRKMSGFFLVKPTEDKDNGAASPSSLTLNPKR